MIKIRNLIKEDSQHFFDMLMKLDTETKYMMYEPGERNTNITQIEAAFIKSSKEILTLIIDDADNSCIGGFLCAQRGIYNKIKHSAYIVVGLLNEYRHKGLGTEMFKELDKWALANNITRLELTVVSENINAVKLYEKMGFKKEGIKRNSLIIDGKYADEFYMAKILL